MASPKALIASKFGINMQRWDELLAQMRAKTLDQPLKRWFSGLREPKTYRQWGLELNPQTGALNARTLAEEVLAFRKMSGFWRFIYMLFNIGDISWKCDYHDLCLLEIWTEDVAQQLDAPVPETKEALPAALLTDEAFLTKLGATLDVLSTVLKRQGLMMLSAQVEQYAGKLMNEPQPEDSPSKPVKAAETKKPPINGSEPSSTVLTRKELNAYEFLCGFLGPALEQEQYHDGVTLIALANEMTALADQFSAACKPYDAAYKNIKPEAKAHPLLPYVIEVSQHAAEVKAAWEQAQDCLSLLSKKQRGGIYHFPSSAPLQVTANALQGKAAREIFSTALTNIQQKTQQYSAQLESMQQEAEQVEGPDATREEKEGALTAQPDKTLLAALSQPPSWDAPEGITLLHKTLAMLCGKLGIPWREAPNKIADLRKGRKKLLQERHVDSGENAQALRTVQDEATQKKLREHIDFLFHKESDSNLTTARELALLQAEKLVAGIKPASPQEKFMNDYYKEGQMQQELNSKTLTLGRGMYLVADEVVQMGEAIAQRRQKSEEKLKEQEEQLKREMQEKAETREEQLKREMQEKLKMQEQQLQEKLKEQEEQLKREMQAQMQAQEARIMAMFAQMAGGQSLSAAPSSAASSASLLTQAQAPLSLPGGASFSSGEMAGLHQHNFLRGEAKRAGGESDAAGLTQSPLTQDAIASPSSSASSTGSGPSLTSTLSSDNAES